MVWLAAAGFVVAAGAAAWPYLPKPAQSAGISPSDRAGWVNRLFVLVGQAEASGEAAVASAARALIAALVAEKELPRKAR